MLKNFNLSIKLLAIALPSVLVLGVIGVYGAVLSRGGDDGAVASDVRLLGLAAMAGILGTLLTVALVSRSVDQPINDITAAAEDLAHTRVPTLIEAMQRPGTEAPAYPPIEVDQHDELGDLAAALNAIQEATAAAATAGRGQIQAGLNQFVINMARRNQSLLDRQIELIDRLESVEEDPEQLEHLFQLDHLATRMRRTAESMLVVAGAEQSRKRGGPVAMLDVLRVAMSEIEDYRHISTNVIEEAEVASNVAVDLAHLLSEVLENATQFSPPDAPVTVDGAAQPDGTYVIQVVDRGVGMTDEQRVHYNRILAEPPDLEIGMDRSLGFIVVGRLARRLGAKVELSSTPGSGTTVQVAVPLASLRTAAPAASFGSELPLASARPAAPAAEETPEPSAPAFAAEAPAPVAELDLDLPGSAPADQPTMPVDLPVAEAPTFDEPSFEAPTFGEPAFPAPAPEAPAAFEMPGDLPVAESDSPAAEAFEPPVPEAFEPPVPSVDPSVPAALRPPEALRPPAVPSDDAMPSNGVTAADFVTESADDDRTLPDPLASLLGQGPSAPTEVPEETAPLFEAPADPFDAPTDPFAAPADVFQRRPEDQPATPSGLFDGSDQFRPTAEQPSWEAPAPPAPPTPPAKLAEALPEGDAFDAGMAGLLAPAPTDAGLTRRVRGQSIDESQMDGGRPVTSSNRSPEEIRDLLSRFRAGATGADPSNAHPEDRS